MYLWNKRSPSNLGQLTPNQAMRTVYAGWQTPSPSAGQIKPLQGLGAFGDANDPTTWLVGAGTLLGLFLFFRGRRGSGSDKRKIARLASQRALASKALREEGA